MHVYRPLTKLWSVHLLNPAMQGLTEQCRTQIFKIRLGALIPRSVCWSVCRSVCLSVGLSSKNYKKLQNFVKPYKTLKEGNIRGFQPVLALMETLKEVQQSFLDGVFIFLMWNQFQSFELLISKVWYLVGGNLKGLWIQGWLTFQ